MAKLIRFRHLPFSHPSKPLFFSSLSPSPDSNFYNKPDRTLSATIAGRALCFLNYCKSSIHLFQIQANLVTSGLFQDPSFAGRLLKLSSNLVGDVGHTLLIFRCVKFPDAFCVNTVIKSYSCGSYYAEAVFFYVEMLRGGNFYPNGFTFPPLVSACAKLGCLRLGQMCHGHTVKFGVDNVLPVQNSMLHLYACCSLMDAACKVLDEMSQKDLVSWNTVIYGFAKGGDMGVAQKSFDEMPEKNVVSWNVMITRYLSIGNPGNALKLFREMMAIGFGSTDTTMVQAIAACGRSNRLKEGRSVHGFHIKKSPKFSLIIHTAMIYMYSKCGRADIARFIFDRMPSKNSLTWNAMILGHCIHGDPLEGLSLYSEMVGGNRILPDELTFIGVLCACARTGQLERGRYYLSQMTDAFGLKPDFTHYWCMANLMAGVGLKQEAVNVLKNIPADEDAPLASAWAGLFGSCRFEGDVELGEQIAKKLIEEDPLNFGHYNLLVNVYTAAGRWEEVARTKEMMKERGITRLPSCSLKDLKAIVCNAKVGATRQHRDLEMAMRVTIQYPYEKLIASGRFWSRISQISSQPAPAKEAESRELVLSLFEQDPVR